MERRQEIVDRSNQNYISMQVFPEEPAQLSDPAARFTEWAVVEEVESFDRIPQGMHSYMLQPGTYAVFEHNGSGERSQYVHVCIHRVTAELQHIRAR